MNPMTVSNRLTLSFGALIAFLVLIATVSVIRLSSLNDSLDSVVHNRIPKLEELNDVAYRVMDNARIIRNSILLKDEKAMQAQKAAFDKN